MEDILYDKIWYKGDIFQSTAEWKCCMCCVLKVALSRGALSAIRSAALQALPQKGKTTSPKPLICLTGPPGLLDIFSRYKRLQCFTVGVIIDPFLANLATYFLTSFLRSRSSNLVASIVWMKSFRRIFGFPCRRRSSSSREPVVSCSKRSVSLNLL